MSILDGLLLGDGGIYNHNRGYMVGKSFFGQSCNSEDYLLHIKTQLELEGVLFPEKCIYVYNRKRKVYEGYTSEYRLTSRFSDLLHSQRNRWYPEGIKIVPKDLVLTPEILKHWYIGDGSLITWRNYLWKVKFCVLGFTHEEQLLLKEMIGELGFSCRVNHKRGEITVNRSNVPKFLEYIGTCPVNYYYYKWDLESLSKVHPNTQIKKEKLLRQEK